MITIAPWLDNWSNMKRILFITIFAVILSRAGYSEQTNQSLNRIVAVVNEDIITQRELEYKKAFLIYQIKQGGKKDITNEEEKELEKALIDRLIVNKLVKEEAKRENILITKDKIGEKIDNVKKKFPNEEAFIAGLKEVDLTIEDLEESFEYELILQKLFFNKVRNKIVVSPQEIENFYKKKQEEFREAERLRLKNIFIYKQGRSPEEIRQRLEEIGGLLGEDVPFEEVAKKYSEGATAFKGGVMGEIKKGELSPRIEEIIFSLSPGEISQWIETESGFYLFKIDERIPGKILDFADVQLEIRNIIYKHKLDEKFNEWIVKLKEKAFIQINE